MKTVFLRVCAAERFVPDARCGWRRGEEDEQG